MLSAMSWINSITWAVDFQLRLFLSILLTLGGRAQLILFMWTTTLSTYETETNLQA